MNIKRVPRKAILLILLGLVVFIPLIFLLSLYLNVQKLTHSYPVYDLKSDQYKLVKEKPKTWIAEKDISEYAKWAIIVSEDWAFFDHNGLDFNQLTKVLEESVEEKKLVRGASTITQQVVKNSLLTPRKTLTRKFKEMIMALMLEKVLSKKQILEIYLNLIELGKDLYGIKPAAEFYFQKKPIQLNAKEGAFLAMLLPSPVRYAQSFRAQKLTDFARTQIGEILVKMRQAGIISEEQRQEQARKVLSFEALNYFGEDILDIEKEILDLEIDSELMDVEKYKDFVDTHKQQL